MFEPQRSFAHRFGSGLATFFDGVTRHSPEGAPERLTQLWEVETAGELDATLKADGINMDKYANIGEKHSGKTHDEELG